MTIPCLLEHLTLPKTSSQLFEMHTRSIWSRMWKIDLIFVRICTSYWSSSLFSLGLSALSNHGCPLALCIHLHDLLLSGLGAIALHSGIEIGTCVGVVQTPESTSTI